MVTWWDGRVDEIMKYTWTIFVDNVTGTNYTRLQAFIIDKFYPKFRQVESSRQVSVTSRISSSDLIMWPLAL